MGALRNPKYERYAFERALLTPKQQAVEAAGFGAETSHGRRSHASRLDRMPQVQQRINELRGQDEEMLREKRARLEERLNVVAFGDILKDCCTINEKTGEPEVDWNKVIANGLSVIISKFKFDKETGQLTDFERDRALDAIAQLRQLNGLDAPKRIEMTGKDQSPLIPDVTDEQRVKALAVFLAKLGKDATADSQ
jgi:hypothetical protein